MIYIATIISIYFVVYILYSINLRFYRITELPNNRYKDYLYDNIVIEHHVFYIQR